jgi:S-(hydroxymethyl)glutathione dehydrogenase/alcohol dehydrogenase
MKAALLTGPGPLEVKEIDINGPEDGEVMVRIRACGVCHSDLHSINGARAAGQPLPRATLLGHEAAGVVQDIGRGVTTVAPGDHVIMAFHPSCGKCFYCVRGQPQICERTDYPDRRATGARPRLSLDGVPVTQGIGVGGFAEYTCMPEGGVVKVRDDAPLETVCLVGCGVTTGIGAALWTAKVQAGSDVAVIGVGGVGLNIIQGAKLASARRVIAVDLLDNKLEMARRFGATDLVNASREDPVAKVKELTNGYLDYAFEAIGLPQTVEQAFAMVRPGGTAVAVGVTRGNVTVPGGAFLQEKKLIGSLYGSASVQAAIPRLVDLYMDGKVMLDELVSRRRPLEEINEAFEDMEKGAVARSVIEFPW